VTYLNVVIQRLMLDYLNHLWGKWRPSAEAERLGPVAILLERLTVRDGYTFDEACEILRTNHQIETSWRDLARLAARLPHRETRRLENEQELQHMAAPGPGSEERILEEEKSSLRHRVEETLGRAVAALPEEDQVIVRMCVWDNFTVAQIARILGLDQKPLYRRLQKIFETLRQSLQREGIRREDIDDFLGS
jgi:RNA polymerase sigma factor for flagellar operon FliA